MRDGEEERVTSQLTMVELVSGVRRAFRGRRFRHVDQLLARIAAELADPHQIAVLRFEPSRVLPVAERLVLTHPLGSLDAVHLAVALVTAQPLAEGDPFTFVTRDPVQAKAARAEGLTVA